MKILTHNGVFHADDVFSACILAKVMRDEFGKEPELIRTRDPKLFGTADVVFDVGGVYDPEKGRFDHHQSDAPTGENGRPYSSAGLIWKEFGERFLSGYSELTEEARKMVWKILDDSFVKGIDRTDCGQGKPARETTISKIIASFNPGWNQPSAPEDFNSRFRDACRLMATVLENEVARAIGQVLAEETVISAARIFDGKVVILEQFMPWQQVIFRNLEKFQDALFIIFPGPTGDWRLQAIPVGPEDPFTKRKALPTAWGGLSGDALVKATNVLDAKFCHRELFICGAQSFTGVAQMAALAIVS